MIYSDMNIHKNKLNTQYSTKIGFVILSVYFFMSYFEGYINQLVSPITKYFIIIILAYYTLLMLKYKITIRAYSIFMLLWLLFKNASLLWGGTSYLGMEVVRAHFASQTLMVLLFIIISSISFNRDFVNRIINVNLYFSGLLSTLAIFFSEPFRGTYTARNTLTILGAQMDPNDLSAFYIFCVVISLQKLLSKSDNKIFHIYLVLVGLIAMGLTASRGGLISLVGIVIMMILANDGKDSSNSLVQRLVIIIILLIVFMNIAKISLPEETYARLFLNSYGGGSGRVDIWKVTYDAFIDKPILGYGWGGSYYRAHNTYLNILIDTGIIGIIPFITSIILMFKKAVKQRQFIGVYLLLCSLFPAFFIEGITKRFFWNGIILAAMLINSKKRSEVI